MGWLKMSNLIEEVSVQEFAIALENHSPEKLQLIDVRETQEVETAMISGFSNLPLSKYEQWSDQIHQQFDAEKETFVICHHGVRSAQMCYWLKQQGFSNVKNISGGIDAYSSAIDQNGSIWDIQFDSKGRVTDDDPFNLGRITLSADNTSAKRCVFVSTILGSLREAKDGDCN